MNGFLNNRFTISFLVQNESGEKVSDDSPILYIKHLPTNKFWDGVSWGEETQLSFLPLSEGFYVYDFTPNLLGDIEVVKQSVKYNLRSSEIYTILEDGELFYDWKLNQEHTIRATSESNSATQTRIRRLLDGLYFSEDGWTENDTLNNMTPDIYGTASFSFTPDVESKYEIEVLNLNIYSYILDVKENADSLSPMTIRGSQFKDSFGNTCEVVNGVGKPILGAKVSIYDLNDGNKFVVRVLTDSSGDWSTSLVPGRYLFKFELEGYIPKSFEKQVI